MTESDDPVTLGIIAVGTFAASGGFGGGGLFGGGGDDSPSVTAQSATPKKTAKRLDQGSDAARKKRLKSASALTRNFDKPTLAQPGLLGVHNEL